MFNDVHWFFKRLPGISFCFPMIVYWFQLISIDLGRYLIFSFDVLWYFRVGSFGFFGLHSISFDFQLVSIDCGGFPSISFAGLPPAQLCFAQGRGPRGGGGEVTGITSKPWQIQSPDRQRGRATKSWTIQEKRKKLRRKQKLATGASAPDARRTKVFKV